MPSLRPTVSACSSATAAFFCPVCGGDRLGSVHDGRQRVSVGGRDLVPWRRTDAHVRCTTCASRLPTSTLDVLTSEELAARLVDVTRVLTVLTVAAGGGADRELRRRAVQHVRTVLPTYDQNRLDRDLACVRPAEVADHLVGLDDALAVWGKERLVVGMVTVALAAHTITDHQRWLIDATGRALGLTPLHVGGIITGVAAAVEPAAADDASDAG